MKIIESVLLKLQISDSWGFKANLAIPILQVIKDSLPLFQLFSSPSPFVAFYEQDNEQRIRDKTLPAILHILKSGQSDLENTRVYLFRVEFLFERLRQGKEIGMPIGGSKMSRKESIVYEHLEEKSET
jgi:hypothetical protein